MDSERIGAMAEEGKNFPAYDCSRYEQNAALGACKGRRAVLSRLCVRIFVDTHFADVSFVRCVHEPSYRRRLQDAIDANLNATEENPGPQRCYFDKLYTNLYLMQGDTRRTRALKLEIRQRTSVRNLILFRRHNLAMVAVLLKNRYRHYISVSKFRR